VAFFRNLNLGQPGSPTRDQLMAAFAHARATDVSSFQSNGTVVFRASAPARTTDLVRTYLVAHTEWHDVSPVRPWAWLLDVVGASTDVGDQAEVSMYDARADFPEPLPWRPARGRVTVVRADRRHAVSVNDLPRTSYATPVLEALLGVAVTSRGLSTLQRLVERAR
jgi:hypothetical protein